MLILVKTERTRRGLRQQPFHQLPSHRFTIYVSPKTLKLSVAITDGGVVKETLSLDPSLPEDPVAFEDVFPDSWIIRANVYDPEYMTLLCGTSRKLARSFIGGGHGGVWNCVYREIRGSAFALRGLVRLYSVIRPGAKLRGDVLLFGCLNLFLSQDDAFLLL
jgi:hypothetical protein